MQTELTPELTRRDTAFLKGIAILAIVMHNFCHWIPGSVVENEYRFSVQNSLDLLQVIAHGAPHVLLNLFSYFGCYGVPVFLFLSGYGLVKKYEKKCGKKYGASALPPVGRFVRYNALKLWRLMAAGVLLLYLYESLLTTGWRHGYANIVWLFAFVSNFFPQTVTPFLPRQDLLVGPWWYFSLTMQMYLLWRLAFAGRGRRALLLGAAVCVAAQLLAVTLLCDEGQTLLNYLRYTLLGCMLPFVLGVWAARYGLPRKRTAFALCAAVFAASLFSVAAWIVAPLCVAFMAVALRKVTTPWLRRPFEWLGGISAALFVLHPVARCLFNPRYGGDVYRLLAAYLATGIVAAWLLTKLLKLLPKPRL